MTTTDKQLKAVLYMGVPGSGKDTHFYANYKGMPRYCTDDQFMVNGKYKFDITRIGEAHDTTLREYIHECFVRAEPVVACTNTNSSLFEILPYLRAAECHGYDIEIVHMDCDPQVAFERNTHGVPETTIMAMHKRIQGTLEELHTLAKVFYKDWTFTTVKTS